MDNITYTKKAAVKGSKTIAINVDKNGQPFGQIWTFKDTRTETNRWHAKTLGGAYRNFPKSAEGLTKAKIWIAGQEG